jgi:tetratricopeptide (TPR) repeat protein
MAVEYFEEAIDKDPGYALAYASLADSYGLIGYIGFRWISSKDGGMRWITSEEAYNRANIAVMRALALDGRLAEAHTAMALLKYHLEENAAEAERELKLAIALNPNYSTAHLRYAHILLSQARLDEAFESIKKAHDLDPLSVPTNSSLAYVYYLKRDYDRAIEYGRKALESEPRNFSGLYYLGFMYQQKGMYREALEQFEKAKELAFSENLKGALGHFYAVTGRREEAQKLLSDLKERLRSTEEADYNIALISAGLGDVDQALDALEGCDENLFKSNLSAIKFDPRFESLRQNPRYADLIRRRSGLP